MTSSGMINEFNLAEEKYSSGTSKDFNLAEEKYSSGTILSNILSNDASELKQSIDNYMETKLIEFQNIMKMKVDSFITGKLNNFYNKPFEGYDKILFDTDGKKIIQQCNFRARLDINECPTMKITTYQWYPLSENNNCFIINHTKRDPNGNLGNILTDKIYIFNTYYIYIEGYSDGIIRQPEVINHNLSLDCLFSIKHFQANNIKSGFGLYKLKPEYFNKNCSHFEEICKKEYNEIEKQKNQLNILINDNLSKKEYYDSLENKIKELEFQKQQIEEKLEKIEEELEKIKDGEKKVELDKQKIE